MSELQELISNKELAQLGMLCLAEERAFIKFQKQRNPDVRVVDDPLGNKWLDAHTFYRQYKDELLHRG